MQASSRRSFLTGLGAALLAAPAIVRASSIMPVKPFTMAVGEWHGVKWFETTVRYVTQLPPTQAWPEDRYRKPDYFAHVSDGHKDWITRVDEHTKIGDVVMIPLRMRPISPHCPPIEEYGCGVLST